MAYICLQVIYHNNCDFSKSRVDGLCEYKYVVVLRLNLIVVFYVQDQQAEPDDPAFGGSSIRGTNPAHPCEGMDSRRFEEASRSRCRW